MKINESLSSIGIVVVIVFALYSFGNNGQNVQQANATNSHDSSPRIITVTGSAEMMVEPDQVELEITIHESSESQLEKAEKHFYEILSEHNIEKSDVSYNQSNNYWYWYYWWSYRNRPILRKQFYISLDGNTDFLALVKSLNKNWVQNVRVNSTNNSRMQELREEVKKEAVKAAKNKAGYMLQSIDERVGQVISIEEVTQNNNNIQNPYWYYSGRNTFNSNSVSNSVVSYTPASSGGSGEVENAHSIKLRYEVVATFKIE